MENKENYGIDCLIGFIILQEKNKIYTELGKSIEKYDLKNINL